MKKLIIIILLSCFCHNSYSQNEENSTNSIGERIFLPALELGYVHNNSANLSGGLMLKTSIEYRLKQNNNVFLRLNYDTYDSEYNLEKVNSLTNIITGTVLFSDLILGGGYRIGNDKTRFFVLLQSGLKFYDYPNATQTNSVINIKQNSRNIFTTRITFGFEYYINDKSAISIDMFQNQIWKETDFWNDKTGALGISVGFITSLF